VSVRNYAYLDPSWLSHHHLAERKHVCGNYTVIVIKWLGMVCIYISDMPVISKPD